MLNYEISGTGKEDLVLLHGFMENLLIWEEMEAFLSKKFRLIKIDLPGHGLSKMYSEVHSMDLMAQELKKVTDKLQIDRFHLLGHSMGGYASLAFAEKFPETLKTLTLFFSSYFEDDKEKKEQRRKSFRIITDSYPNYVKAGIPNLFNENEKDILEGKIELAKEIALSTRSEGALAAVKGMLERTDKTGVMENFEGKILVIAGKYDNAVKTEVMLKNLPDRTNIKSYLLDCGHNGHWEKPEICAAILNTELLHDLPKNFIF
ncbi:MAG: alpha/beta fold hydrolase [Weeksellaceae bacterium]|nr:alpha/beta fold hydrolase [Weeksellaceae bacterium]